MNSLIFDIANMLRENEIAIKVYNRTIDEDEIFILNMENIEDFDSIEDKEKWFEELN